MSSNASNTVRPLTELGEHATALVEEVVTQGRPLVLTRDGTDVAVLLSMEQFRALQANDAHGVNEAVAEAETDVLAGRTRAHDEVAAKLRRWAGRGA